MIKKIKKLNPKEKEKKKDEDRKKYNQISRNSKLCSGFLPLPPLKSHRRLFHLAFSNQLRLEEKVQKRSSKVWVIDTVDQLLTLKQCQDCIFIKLDQYFPFSRYHLIIQW